jgi:hypothetical protein
MSTRTQVTRTFRMREGRQVTITAYEQIGPEDCMTMLLKAVLHRHLTGEDVVPPIAREVKDAMIKQNLVI